MEYGIWNTEYGIWNMEYGTEWSVAWTACGCMSNRSNERSASPSRTAKAERARRATVVGANRIASLGCGLGDRRLRICARPLHFSAHQRRYLLVERGSVFRMAVKTITRVIFVHLFVRSFVTYSFIYLYLLTYLLTYFTYLLMRMYLLIYEFVYSFSALFIYLIR